MPSVEERIAEAVKAVGLTQRDLEQRTGISQSTLNRIITGRRRATMPEVVSIARATGYTIAQLSGSGAVADRVQYAARATNGSGMDQMRAALLHYAELSDYLDDQAIPAAR